MQVLSIGSSVIDIFVHTASEKHTSISHNTVTLHLGDKIPIRVDRFTLGGNGANIAVGLKRLGHETTFYTYFGDDILSKEIEETLTKEGVTLIPERDKETSSLSFILGFTTDRIIFSHHPPRLHGFKPPHSKTFDCIYLTSIGNQWEDAYRHVLDFAQRTQTPIAFSPGSHQIDEMGDLVLEILQQSKYVFVNSDEARRIAQYLGKKVDTVPELLDVLHSLGLTYASITDGEKGAYATDGMQKLFIQSVESPLKVEKTGAGDAYATGFLAAMLHQKPVVTAMQWGSYNAFSVMCKTGAQTGLLDQDSMLRLVEKNGTVNAEKI